MREIIKHNSTKFLIESILFFALSLNISSQELPLLISKHTGKHYNEFGSGVKYYFVNPGESLENSFIKELYYDGKAAYEQKNYIEAKKKLLEFMDNEITANDISENGLPNNKILKYHTSLMLKDIYYKEKNYLQSLYYYDLARYKYTWGLGRCGMMSPYLTEEEIYRFTCYEGTGRNSLAIETILFKILTNESVDTNLVKRLVDLLYKNNNNEYLKIELTSNINNIEDTDAVNGRIKFMNNYLYVFDLQQIWQLSTEEKAIKIKEKIQNHLFYKLIMEN